MTQGFRLSEGGLIDRSKPLQFEFNGRTYQGFEGDSLASALLANGVHFVARSWKYHRPRGVLTAGVEEPNAVVQLESGRYAVPNPKAPEVYLYEGLKASSVNAEPSIENDRMAFVQRFSRFLPAGFYYKTFMWPRKFWPRYEERIRRAAGLGKAPSTLDADTYDKQNAHCDVLVVGAGPAGLTAALTMARSGVRVMLVDLHNQAGGSLMSTPDEVINGMPALEWVKQVKEELASLPNVNMLFNATAFGYQPHNLVTVVHRLTDHLPIGERRGRRERIYKVRAKQVILATGAHERPLVFGNNDLPGIMLSAAITTYINRYAVLPGRQAIIFTNNDEGYRAAIALREKGASVTVVDPRPLSEGALPNKARSLGISVMQESVVTEAFGEKFDHHIEKVNISIFKDGKIGPTTATLCCDLLGVSGGWSPVIHLFSQSGGKAQWSEEKHCFVPGGVSKYLVNIGACNGEFSLADIQSSLDTLVSELSVRLNTPITAAEFKVAEQKETPMQPLWLVGDPDQVGRGAKQFVDFQNDVTAADIHLAAREGFRSIEHVKRYTAMGFGTDQGKTGNINGMAILAQVLGNTIAETGTTTFRPNYTPVTFGALAGRALGEHFDPVRTTCIHDWHVEHGALFEDVGTWKRPWYYAKPGEDIHAAVKREVQAVRSSVGILDASTLGKIDVYGPDAADFLNLIYTNAWTKLGVGKCRYGLMLDENGMVIDDGVNIRLGEQHFLVSTTTGGAAKIMAWMERWLQTEWPHMKVYMSSLTDHYSCFAVAGPNARKVLEKVCHDIDFSHEAFPFMSFKEGTIDQAPVRIMRISFSGELSYEVNVPSNMGRVVWDRLIEAGQEFNITPYGTETMHVLRAEKGFIIVGQDTDGSVTPYDLGMGGLCSKAKDFIGKRSLSRSDTARTDRKQFVGILTDDPNVVLQEGAQILREATEQRPAPMLGHITSSYFSPTLGRSIALAVVKDGFKLKEQQATIQVWSTDTGFIPAKVVDPVFYDKEGGRQNV